MNEIRTSSLLTQLIEASKEVGNKPNPPFTAERFLVAIIDKINANDGWNIDSELLAVSDLVKEAIGNLSAAREALLAYICRENGTTFLDDLYMKKKIQEAYSLSSKSNMSEVDSVLLFQCIAKDPSNAIRSVLPGFASKNDSMPESFSFSSMKVSDTTKEKERLPRADASDLTTIAKDTNAVKSDILSLVSEAKRIRTDLRKVVFGQDNAINTFVSACFQANLLSLIGGSRRRPRATFLFAGPPGVGKTFLAEKAAEVLKLPFRRFDMSEYVDKEASLEFCGSDDVFKGSKSGNVTSFVMQNPKCILLFDEIEKAHISIIHLFLQMLDAGRLRDSKTDREISFSDTILIFTTNAGKQLYEESESGDLSSVSRKVIIKALQKDVNPQTGIPFFPGAICSRFASGNVLMFNHINAHDLRTIAKNEIERNAASFEKETGIRLFIDDRVYTAILLSEGSTADARTIRSRAEAFFNEELYELLRLVSSEKVETGFGDIDGIQISVDLSRADSYVCELFAPTDKTKVLVFADPATVAFCRENTKELDIVGSQTVENAVGVIKTQSIDFVLLDVRYGASQDEMANLNIEDAESPARDFFKFLREQKKDIPVYMIADHENDLVDEEMISFMSQGVRGVLYAEGCKIPFAKQLSEVTSSLHQQAALNKLAKENKLVSFETAQTVSVDGKDAQIRLFDFKMGVAVEAEDAKNVLSAVSRPDVHFDDVIGAEDAKKELAYFVKYLENPKKYLGTGVKAPKGVILYGPPGTGKTMLAKAMACEAGVTFIAAEGNQFLKKYVGEGAEAVHDLFRTARKYAPSILFIDEIDAIAKERRGGDRASNGEETLTAFLTEMDGFINDPSKPVFVLAATNFDVEPGRNKSLDPALMRRFDRRVYIDLPNKDDRIRFLKLKIANNHALDISEKQIENISMRATGMSLAELDSVVELALRSAIREGSTVVNDAILEEAFETFNGGEAKKWDVSQLERVARHESGHAFLCWLSGETPSYVTIVARGSHGGYMQHQEQEGKGIYTKDELLKKIRTSLGGRAAEIVYYGERDGISTGASGDLASATALAQQIICTYGMDDDFGLAVVYGAASGDGSISAEVRDSINRILKEQMNEAVRLISENTDKIDSLVEVLMTKNHLNGAEIESVLTKNSSGDASKVIENN